jgi:hypothetical protein
MGDNTAVRAKAKWKEWFWKNGFSLIVGTLVALLTFLSSWIFQTITELQEATQRVEAKLSNQTERDLATMWAILKNYEEQVTEHEIQIRLHDRLIGLHAADDFELNGMDYDDVLNAIRDIMENDESLYEYRIEEQMQQQMQEQYLDKSGYYQQQKR